MKKKLTRKTVKEEIDRLLANADFTGALNLVIRFRTAGYTVTKTTLKKDYKLKDKEIDQLAVASVKNPVYATAPGMKLFLRYEAELISGRKVNTSSGGGKAIREKEWSNNRKYLNRNAHGDIRI